ncbi:MAG: hypothetical protein JWN14_4516 [Chthonomonadales bacterium]|nr:hypothetical protein [Chthonomonadales bacterium]
MKQQIPGAVAIAIAVLVGVLVIFFGWRKVSGSDNDVTQETINRYQNMSKQTFGGDGSKAGPNQATHGVPPAGSSNNMPNTGGMPH